MTATATLVQPTRMFRFGSTELADPMPNDTPENALACHAFSMPVLSRCALSEPYLEGDQLVFDVIKPEGKTKG
jgi:hypothetical protein